MFAGLINVDSYALEIEIFVNGSAILISLSLTHINAVDKEVYLVSRSIANYGHAIPLVKVKLCVCISGSIKKSVGYISCIGDAESMTVKSVVSSTGTSLNAEVDRGESYVGI